MRYELKYFVPEKDLLKCQAIVLQHPASFSEEFPDREINNIYLDSPDLISYAEGQSGISSRRKFRIRWYGPWDDIQDPVLEIKIKENQLGTKEHQKLTSFQISDLARVLEDLRKNHTIPLAFGPSSLNRYRRSYFRSFCGKFRITIDRNLMFGLAKSDIKRPSIPSGLIVLELKYETSDDDQADWIKQFIPLQRAKFSKYIQSFM